MCSMEEDKVMSENLLRNERDDNQEEGECVEDLRTIKLWNWRRVVQDKSE